MANLAEVSQSAVSRTFTPGASVSPKTREKVLKAARELGYAPVVDFETGMNALERPSRNAAPEAALVRA